ncbi:hypothetical protein CLV81_2815 [Flagellimonas meridianipacifica]|uniref:Uncharacterized protein n=1 Tax=Flagellimonas meridianipacifica TaxID=1080225 RepID=A0A2T0MA78_9FLAO|nr:hypothetical protein CLV81_2815 [Allomuricauda pacifica]
MIAVFQFILNELFNQVYRLSSPKALFPKNDGSESGIGSNGYCQNKQGTN